MKVSRRTVLKGLGGAALALPVLESLSSTGARAADASTSFAVFFRQASGVACRQDTEVGEEPERFWPTELGPLTEATMAGRAVDELSAYAPRLLIVKNVNMMDFNYGDGHARGALQGLTARGPTVEEAGGDSEAAGESIDHRIGRELNPDGRDSLFLYAGPNGGWLGGACISYRGSGQRRAAQRNPWGAYESIVGDGTGLSPEEAAQVKTRQKSVNDLVRGQLERLMSSPKLSSSDRERLELHFDSIRETEVALACRFEEDQRSILETGSSVFDSNNGEDIITTVKLHMDVAALAIACGFTRSVAIQVGNGNDAATRYLNPETGDRMENYHYISHRRLSHGSDGEIIAGADLQHHYIDRYFGQMFRYLLDRLDAYQLPNGGSLLEAGIALWYNDNGNGPGHSRRNIPTVIAGSAGGFLKQGQYLEVSDGDSAPNHNQLLNTLGSAVGVRNAAGEPLDDFGDPSLNTGRLSELLA